MLSSVLRVRWQVWKKVWSKYYRSNLRLHVPYYLESSCAQLPKTLRTNVWSSDWSFKWTRGFIPIAYRWNTGSSSNSEMWRHVGNVHRLEKISANWFFAGENSGSLNAADFYRRFLSNERDTDKKNAYLLHL